MPKPTDETYNELQAAYDFFNSRLFDGALPPCLLTLNRKKRTYGYFSSSRFVKRSGELTDEIALNPSYFSIRSIPAILSTLVHEQVHLYQEHFGSPGRRRYHNVEWGDMMQERGLMPSATGEPGGPRTGDCMSHYIIEDGPFDLACKDLLTDRFTLTWLDRFPPYIPTPVPVELPPPTGGGEDPGEPTSGAVPVGVDFEPDDLSGLGISLPVEPVNKSNRVKYRCPKCGLQVWGKPGLENMLGCLACQGLALKAVE